MSSGKVSRSGAKPSAGPPAPGIPLRPSTKGSSISERNLCSNFLRPSRARRNADEMGIYAHRINCPPGAKQERKRTETAESERKTAEKTAEDSPSVRGRAAR